MLIYAKSALNKEQIDVKNNIGCDGIEIQLLGELVKEGLGSYYNINEVIDLSEFEDYNIKVVHAPILSKIGLSDINLEDFLGKNHKLLEQTLYIANYFGEVQGETIVVVIHSECTLNRLKSDESFWNKLLCTFDIFLTKYKNIEIAIENVTPIRSYKDGYLTLGNNFTFENTDIANELNKELNTNRFGTCLDICHAMMAERYVGKIYEGLEEASGDYSLDAYFKKNKTLIKLIHLADFKGNGYGKENHGTPFGKHNKDKLRSIIDLYNKYEYKCPITLEVREDDFLISDCYKMTKETLDDILGRHKGDKDMYKQLIIVRKDLEMSHGKMAAQVAHASQQFLFKNIKEKTKYDYDVDHYETRMLFFEKDMYEEWLNGNYTKVVCSAKNKNDLLKVIKYTEELDLKLNEDFFIVRDLCFTELEPEDIDDKGIGSTITCIGFRPLPDEIMSKISRKYQLYK